MRSKSFISILLIMSLVGCGVTAPIEKSSKPSDPIVQKATLESYAQGLADLADAKAITTPREMAEIANVSVRLKFLSADDVSKLESAFSGMAKDNRTLTADDSKTLRGLK